MNDEKDLGAETRNRRQGAYLDGRDDGRQEDAQRSVRRQLNGR